MPCAAPRGRNSFSKWYRPTKHGGASRLASIARRFGGETLPLSAILSRVLSDDVVAPLDAPPFDRSNVDGFAVRAADTIGASDGAPKRFLLNAEVIACGDAARDRSESQAPQRRLPPAASFRAAPMRW